MTDATILYGDPTGTILSVDPRWGSELMVAVKVNLSGADIRYPSELITPENKDLNLHSLVNADDEWYFILEKLV